MSVCYLNISIQIHGLKIEDKGAVDFLVGWIKEETKAGLLGKNKDIFKFRNEFESDIEVELLEYAGDYSNT